MITLLLLLLTVITIAVLTFIFIGTGCIGFIIIFGDLAIAIYVIVKIIKSLFTKKKES